MKWTSIIAIYSLFWVLSAFVVLPFYAKTADEAGVEKIPGQAESAPAEFRPLPIAGWTTLVSAIAFVIYYVIYVNGWAGFS